MTDQEIDILCEVMHIAYEDAAAGQGWETNKKTMRTAVKALLDSLDPVRMVIAGDGHMSMVVGVSLSDELRIKHGIPITRIGEP